jgi:hypothetical protein
MEMDICLKTGETLHSENTLNGNLKHQNQIWILKLHYKNIYHLDNKYIRASTYTSWKYIFCFVCLSLYTISQKYELNDSHHSSSIETSCLYAACLSLYDDYKHFLVTDRTDVPQRTCYHALQHYRHNYSVCIQLCDYKDKKVILQNELRNTSLICKC